VQPLRSGITFRARFSGVRDAGLRCVTPQRQGKYREPVDALAQQKSERCLHDIAMKIGVAMREK
jgi:hypothetical protein